MKADHLLSIAELSEKKEEANMAVSNELAQFITKIDAATDAIAARIQNLINTSHTLTDDDKAALQAEVDKLNLLGQDVNNPIPPAATA